MDNNMPKTYLDKKELLPNAEFVLISYAHSSKDSVYFDLNALYSKGLNFWYDKELLSGDVWYETIRTQLQDNHCCGIIFFLDINCLINVQQLADGDKEITGRSAVEKEIKIFEEIRRNRPEMRAFCVLNAEDQSVYSIIRNAFIKCANLSDSQLKQVLPESRVLTLLQAFNSDKIYILRTNDYVEQIIQTISKTNPLVVTNSKSALQVFEDTFVNCIYKIENNVEIDFGSYHQSPCGDFIGCVENMTQIINGKKVYTKNKKPYEYEPIRWVLMETDGVTATLQSKKVLDVKDGTQQSIEKWLSQFVDSAFSDTEKEAVEEIDVPSVEITNKFGGKLRNIEFTDYVNDCFDGGQCYVWLKDLSGECRKMLCAIHENVPDIDYDYIDARNGIMPIIKIKLEKIRRI